MPWMMIFGLNCAGMNSVKVQHLSDGRGHRHEIMVAGSGNMHGGNNFVLRELPDMEFMKRKHAFDS